MTARQGFSKLPTGGYLSMNAGAWQPRRTPRHAGLIDKIRKTLAVGRGNDPFMPASTDTSRPLRVLVSEGNSTSAREAITILGLSGHHVEICDPSRACLARFSRFIAKFHRCPGLRDDPVGYLAFIETLLAQERFDVLLPTHEQGFLFARVADRLRGRVGLALPDFASYRAVHNKAGFCRLLDRLGLPQPATQIVKSERELRAAILFPAVVKTSVGTASRGIWFVRDDSELESAVQELRAGAAFADEVLVQDYVAGATEKAQAVFCRGRLLGFHAYRQIAAGAGGGEAIKQSVAGAKARALLAVIGEHLAWHGALSVDYLLRDDDAAPLLIDCNPRLVEPMSGYLAGIDLVSLLLRISLGETPPAVGDSRPGVRTHLAMQVLLGGALRGDNRRDLVRELWRVLTGRGAYAGSAEELTPVKRDGVSAVPLAMTAISVLLAPKLAKPLARRGWGAHLLDPAGIRLIERDDFVERS
jgi:predicted ATP-grasp superfamily ATP-dependent carboligase